MSTQAPQPQPQSPSPTPSASLDDAVVGAAAGIVASALGVAARGAVPGPLAAALTGVAYRSARRALPTPGPPAFHGAGFGFGLWLLARLAAGTRPLRAEPAGRSPRRLVGHVVFGAVLGVLAEPPRPCGRGGPAQGISRRRPSCLRGRRARG